MAKKKAMGSSLRNYKSGLFGAVLGMSLLGACLSAPAMAGEAAGSPNVSKIAKYIVGVKDLDKAYAYYHALGAELEQTGPLAKPAPISPMLQKLYGVPTGTQFRSATLKLPASDVAMQLVEFTNIERRADGPRFHDPGAIQLVMDVRDIDAGLNAAKAQGAKVITSGGAPVEIGFPGDPAPTQAIVLDDLEGHYVEFVKVNPKHVVNKFGELPAVTNLKKAVATHSNVVFTSFRTVVDDLDKTAAFYRADRFGMETMAAPWAKNAENLMRMSGVMTNADARVGEMRTQGTKPMHGWTFFATTAKDATSYSVRLPDPGGYAIGLDVRDLTAAVSAIKEAGGAIVTTGGEGLKTPSGDVVVLARDPNGILLELVQHATKS